MKKKHEWALIENKIFTGDFESYESQSHVPRRSNNHHRICPSGIERISGDGFMY
jgi:hypothetical protein